MIPYNQAKAMALEDAFPDFLSGGGIFDALNDFDFIPNSGVALALNQEYYLNRSGRKLASPLVTRLVDSTTGTLDVNTINQLGSIITVRFRAKWDKFWQDLISSNSVFQNIDYIESTQYGHKIDKDGSNSVTKSGSETRTLDGEQDVEESFPDNGRITTRSIVGGWKDTDTTARTRTGAETTTESFPGQTGRITEKVTKGGWTDTDGTATTRTGVQTVTDSGDTQESVFGFNSSLPVPASRSGPVSQLTQQTSYGENGIKDQKSGSITRAYNDTTGLQEKTVETGSKQLQTSYGEAGIKDTNSGDLTRLYQNYQDTVSETGRKLTKTTYGESGKTDSLTFNNRSDSESIDETVEHSGTDTKRVTGYNIRRLSDKLDILKEMYSNPLLYDFFEIVYSDIDLILTCPIFV